MSKKVVLSFIFSAIAVVGIFGSCATASVVKPKKNSDFFKITARVLNMDESSGGTGSIIYSSKSGSVILTNAHVCEVVQEGGVVDPPSHQRALIMGIKMDTKHDLCLVSVSVNLGVSLVVADSSAELGEDIVIAGHPSLLPLIITKGHASENIIFPIQQGWEKCEDKDLEDPKNGPNCLMYGKKPLIKIREAQVVSATISPGSSGSAVFNPKGEIVGVVFAGMGNLSYGFMANAEAVLDFLDRSEAMDWQSIPNR